MRVQLVLFLALMFLPGALAQGPVRPAKQGGTHAQNPAYSSISRQGEAGLLVLKQGRLTEAIPELRQAVRSKPGSWQYSLALAEALLSANYNFTGLRFLLKVKPRFQNLPEYRYLLGLAYYMCYKYPDAIREFETFPQNDPKLNRIPYLIGNCYMAMSDLKQAATSFRQAIKLNPEEATYYVSLAKMLRLEGPQHLDGAISALKKALSLKPQDPYISLHLAYCEEGKHDYKDAQALLDQVIRDQPGFQPARLALATVYEHNHEWARARQQRKIAARLKPPPPVRIPGLGAIASTLAPQ